MRGKGKEKQNTPNNQSDRTIKKEIRENKEQWNSQDDSQNKDDHQCKSKEYWLLFEYKTDLYIYIKFLAKDTWGRDLRMNYKRMNYK